MKKNIAYFKWRDKTTLPNWKLCSKPTYDECFAMQWFCERLIYCLNDKAKERYKMHYEIDYLPDFLLLKNVDISYYQNSICTTKKSQAVLFSFDEKYIPRIVRYTDWSIRRKLPISLNSFSKWYLGKKCLKTF